MNYDPTVMLPLRRMWDRVETTAEESDVAYFYDLLSLGELLTKLVVSSMAASIDDREGNRYKLEHDLLRADGLGHWVDNMAEALTGPPSSLMRREAQPLAQQITQKWGKNAAVWQREAVELLHRSCREIDGDSPDLPSSVSLRWWFSTFVWLRNRTRGHGSPLPGKCAVMVEPLAKALRTITNNLTVLKAPCAVIRRNLSGKYRVVALTTLDSNFEQLKRAGDYNYADGVYFSFGGLCFTPLLGADVDISDVHIANGSFRSANGVGNYEVLSYITDNRQRIDGSAYLNAVAQLPDSKTHGYPDLEVFGETFANLPPQASDYVTRTTLESELRSVLRDDRHPVVSLVGRGGIGKTSLALRVLHELCDTDDYELILWFSARDIDLLSSGPKQVRPQVLTFRDIAEEFVTLLKPLSPDQDSSKPEEYLARALSGQTSVGPILLVVDNFETVRSPSEIYQTLDTHVRIPNKVLITSRHREFKADYPVDVIGMSRPEYDELVGVLSIRLNIVSRLTPGFLNDLYRESEGHPYVAKVMLGEVATGRETRNVRRVLATKDRMLDALFERSYANLPPSTQQVFLTLCNWHSMVTQLELEAALLRPKNEYLDVSAAVKALKLHSMIDDVTTAPDTSFLRVPEAARSFGRKKLRVSHMKPAIEIDTEVLRTFGTVRSGDIKNGLAPRVDRLVKSIAQRAAGGENMTEYLNILRHVATGYPRAWLEIAELLLENPQLSGDPLDAVERYLQEVPEDADAWRSLATTARKVNEPDREMNALYRLAELPRASFEDISNAVQCLNRNHAKRSFKLGREEIRLMAMSLAKTMNAQIEEANGTDLSRLAWLYLHLKQVGAARRCIQRGLEIEPWNRHLVGLKERFGEMS